MQKKTRFSSLGYILATAGSAIGLGAIWKFPYLVGANGGAAFVLLFLVCYLFFGVVVFLAEMFLGKITECTPVSGFEKLAPKGKKWLKYGGFMWLGGIIIFSFYAVILGWAFYYLWLCVFGLPSDLASAQKIFTEFYSGKISAQILCHLVVLVICILVLLNGIKRGIERVSLVLMPLLFFIFLGLLFYSFSFESFSTSFNFLFSFDFSKITTHSIFDAIGTAFFALSLGVGTILVYSCALPLHSNFIKEAFLVALLNLLFCFLAGLVIFTFIFNHGGEADFGPGLVFISLPLAFSSMGAIGGVIGFLFFLAFIFAGITSAVSMLEPGISHLIERHSFSRARANAVIFAIVWLFGLCVIFSFSAEFGENFSFFGRSFFSWFADILSVIFQCLGGIFICVFVGWVIPREKLSDSFTKYLSKTSFLLWYWTLRFIAPLGILYVLLISFFR